jgi:hypothetical protein
MYLESELQALFSPERIVDDFSCLVNTMKIF